MKVFVGCSSSDKLSSIYYDTARKVASFLANKNYDLLIGGTLGVMGIVSKEFEDDNRNIDIMEADCYRLDDDNYKYPVCHHETLYLRKNDLITKANLIVFLPGGIGTFDEIFTAIESKRASEHNNDIVILNINGYYDNLIKLFDNMYENKFANIDDKRVYNVIDDFDEFCNYIDNSRLVGIYD